MSGIAFADLLQNGCLDLVVEVAVMLFSQEKESGLSRAVREVQPIHAPSADFEALIGRLGPSAGGCDPQEQGE